MAWESFVARRLSLATSRAFFPAVSSNAQVLRKFEQV